MPSDRRSGGGEVEILGDADFGFGERGVLLFAVLDFIADDGAEFGVAGFLGFGVADAGEVEVGAVADVAGVLIGPADEAVVLVFRFHGGNLAFLL